MHLHLTLTYGKEVYVIVCVCVHALWYCIQQCLWHPERLQSSFAMATRQLCIIHGHEWGRLNRRSSEKIIC